MANLQKTVLIIQASEAQKAIWSAALTSQKTLVLQELTNADIYQLINQTKDVKKLPDLLLIDIGVHYPNPYTFCRSCRGQDFNMKIILTTGEQHQVTSAERRWAIYQGAQDLLPGFQSETLLDEGIATVNRVLQVLGCLPLQRELLTPILLPVTSSSAPQKTISHQLNNGVSETNKNMLSPESKPTFDNPTPTKRRGHSYR